MGFLFIPIFFVLAIWVTYAIQLILPLIYLGIQPRSVAGLTGIVASPLLHGNLTHLVGNTLSFATVGIFFFLVIKKKTTIFVQLWLLSGFLTWVLGRPHSLHIGASSLIFAMIGYLMGIGFFRRKFQYIAITVAAVFLYEGFLWGLLPSSPHITWEGHVAGFVAGIIISSSKK